MLRVEELTSNIQFNFNQLLSLSFYVTTYNYIHIYAESFPHFLLFPFFLIALKALTYYIPYSFQSQN